MTKYIHDKLMEFKSELEHKVRQWRRDYNAMRWEIQARPVSLFEQEFFVAGEHHYEQWMEGYLKKGNKPKAVHSHQTLRDVTFYLATKDFEVTPCYWSSSVDIIVPEGIHLLGGKLGHNGLYFMDDFEAFACRVTLYAGMRFIDKDVAALAQELLAEDAAEVRRRQQERAQEEKL